jgi:hypothetical protein
MTVFRLAILPAAFALALAIAQSAPAADARLDTAAIERATALKGQWNEQEGVFKVSQPRADVRVVVDGVEMPPFMGLTSWAAFKRGTGDDGAMVMGDMVLFQDEVGPAMSAALDAGLSVTALHNHFFYDEPRVYFMHVGGEGEAAKLAAGVRKVLDAVKAVRSAEPQPRKNFAHRNLPAKSSITAAPLAETIGAKPAEKDGMAKFTLGRTTRMPCGCEAGKEMGVNTWAAFYGDDDSAFVDGDFVTFEGELQPVLKALRAAGINVVAIHNHMEGESPKAIFLHYWGVGPARDLAGGVKAALDAQAKAKRA